VIPSPSHPSNKMIILGIKISRFIDRTKSRTSRVNRFIKGSDAMYLEVNTITLAEIRSTTLENKVPHGSMINGIKIVV